MAEARLLTIDAPPAATVTRPKRIAFLAQENLAVPPPVPGSSVSRVVWELARALAPQHDVSVCSLPHPLVGEGMLDGIHFLRVDSGRDDLRHDAYRQALRVTRKLNLPHRELQGMPFYGRGYARNGLRRLAEQRPEIIHLQNVSHYLPLARRAAPEARLVLHMHCDWLLQLPVSELRRRLEHASLVLGVSRYIRDGICDRFPELADRCRTLHNGVDCEVFRPREELPSHLAERASALRADLGLEGPIALYVGTMAPEKGTDVLLRAFELVTQRVPDARLVIVGRHNRYFQVRAPRNRRTRAELRRRQRSYPAMIASLTDRLGDRVVFAGGVDHEELPAWYALAQAFVMPSTGHEPFPLPVLEALASGVPVVATRRGGLPESVHDGVNGTLVEAGDPEELAAALHTLLDDPTTAQRLGAAGRRLAVKHFTWQQQAACLDRYYEQLFE